MDKDTITIMQETIDLQQQVIDIYKSMDEASNHLMENEVPILFVACSALCFFLGSFVTFIFLQMVCMTNNDTLTTLRRTIDLQEQVIDIQKETIATYKRMYERKAREVEDEVALLLVGCSAIAFCIGSFVTFFFLTFL